MTALVALFWPLTTIILATLAYRAHARHLLSTRASADTGLEERIKSLEEFRTQMRNRSPGAPR